MHTPKAFRLLSFLVVLVFVAAGCDDAGDEDSESRESPFEDQEPVPPADTGSPELDAIIDDIQEFWERADNELDFDFEALPAENVGALDDGEDGPVCDGQAITGEEVDGNAFAADCFEDEVVVAYDADGLFPEMEETYGLIGPAVVLAHEWGHVAQYQAGIDLPTVMAEQQADCFSGAWVGDAYDREFPPLDDETSLDDLVGAVIETRDAPGTAADDEDAHGLGFDRISAFQEGFEGGVDVCVGYIDEPPVLTQVPFVDDADAATGGDLPFDETVPLMAESLDAVFSDAFGDFEPLAESFEEVVDVELLELAHEEIGDAATGAVMAMAWYSTIEESEGSDALLARACGVGAWLGEVVADPDSILVPSPGDFDEAVIATTEVVWGETAGGEPGLVFSSVAALRAGVSEGFGICGSL